MSAFAGQGAVFLRQNAGMSAESIDVDARGIRASVDSLPDWVFPPPGGFTADHFLRMRDLPRQAELIDGALIFAAPQTRWHSHTVSLLTAELRRQAPEDLDAIHGMTVRLDERQAPATDVVVVTAEAMRRERPDHYFFPEDVRLVVEAVLPDSAIRDRDVKPRRYAAAGIKHFWRVEQDGRDAVVYVHELAPASQTYLQTGIYYDRLELTVPFIIDIGLGDVGRRL